MSTPHDRIQSLRIQVFKTWNQCQLTDYFFDDFRILKFDIPEEREYFVDDGRLVQSIDDSRQTGEHIERQLQVASVALEDGFRFW